uniref:Uncharacterized protein n=1 Tax=Salix viminalis TaxID=40686 RepID=A0A6N2LTL3_SALVM
MNSCVAQAKWSQPKDDNWSDCAKNGYAGAVRNANRSESFSVIFPPPSLQRIHIFWEISLLPITFTYAAALALVLKHHC